MVKKLTLEERTALLEKHPAWQEVEGRDAICREFKFADFNEAFGFMTRVAILADKMDHHPEWFNVYNRVAVTMTTHDVDGVSDNDVKMVEFMDGVVS